jgi:hypothetical protein
MVVSVICSQHLPFGSWKEGSVTGWWCLQCLFRLSRLQDGKFSICLKICSFCEFQYEFHFDLRFRFGNKKGIQKMNSIMSDFEPSLTFFRTRYLSIVMILFERDIRVM